MQLMSLNIAPLYDPYCSDQDSRDERCITVDNFTCHQLEVTIRKGPQRIRIGVADQESDDEILFLISQPQHL